MASLLLRSEALDLIGNTSIQGLFFGINCCLYFLCTQVFYHKYRKASSGERRKIALSFLCNSLMVLGAAVELGAEARVMQLAYINHGGVNGEPIDFENKFKASSFTLSYSISSLIIAIINSLMQTWRIWVFWVTSSYRFLIAISPLFIATADISLEIITLLLPETAPIQTVLGTFIFSLNVAFTVLVTLLLVGRILAIQKRHIRHMAWLEGMRHKGPNEYKSIVAMLVESYALDAAWSTAALISYALATDGNPTPVYHIFNDASDQVTVISFLLVTYRILSYSQPTWTGETGGQLSTMRWNHNHLESTINDIGFMDQSPSDIEARMEVGESGSLAKLGPVTMRKDAF